MKVNSSLRTRTQEGIRDTELPPCVPPAPPPSVVSVSLGLPRRAAVTCGNSQARLRAPAVSRSPCVAEWSRRADPLVPIHSLPFTTIRSYKDWLIPIFFFCCLCNEKLSTRSLIKFSAYPTPIPKIPANKKRGET